MTYSKVFARTICIFFIYLDALNFIANSEASKPTKPVLPEKNEDDRLNELFENLAIILDVLYYFI